MANIVQFENVGLRYGTGPETLSDMSFTLASGAFYFLTGASGAGKTSLLKLLYLAHAPDPRRDPHVRRGCGDACPGSGCPASAAASAWCSRTSGWSRTCSAYDNIALPLRVSGVPESDVEAPVREMLAWVGLSERVGAKPPTLSGGEQQRVAIARAVIGRPEILVADEPTGNVDPDMAERLLHLFDSLNRLGTTVVVATHDFHLLGRIPNAHMMRLDGGRLLDPTGSLRFPPKRPDA